MGYNTDGDLGSVTRPNGVATGYGYDAAGRLVRMDSAKGATVVADIGYTLDAAGNRVGQTGPEGAQSFTLDADNRLTAATGGGAAALSYGYDAAGNRTSVTSGGTNTSYTYDAAGRLSKVGASSVSMDADGNLTTAGGDTYTYNAAGALTAASVGGRAAAYTVNADGQRVAITAGGSTSKLVLDVASDLPAVLAETGHRYTRDASGGLLSDTTAGGTQFAVRDAQGTIRALTDSTGAATGTASYDPYGVVRSSTGTATTFGYTGATNDVGGLVNLQAREYNSAYGQFLQADTYTVGGDGTAGYNHYTYTSDNPATGTDPTGRFTSVIEEDVVEDESSVLSRIGAFVGRTAISAAYNAQAALATAGNNVVGIVAATCVVSGECEDEDDSNVITSYTHVGGKASPKLSPAEFRFNPTLSSNELSGVPSSNKRWLVPFTFTVPSPAHVLGNSGPVEGLQEYGCRVTFAPTSDLPLHWLLARPLASDPASVVSAFAKAMPREEILPNPRYEGGSDGS